MTEFITSPGFLTFAVYAVGGATGLFLLAFFARRKPETRSAAGAYMIAHRIDELTPGGMK
jgi:hypothetical protein